MAPKSVYRFVVRDLKMMGFKFSEKFVDLGRHNSFYRKHFSDGYRMTVIVAKNKKGVWVEASEDNSTAPKLVLSIGAWKRIEQDLQARIAAATEDAANTATESDKYATEDELDAHDPNQTESDTDHEAEL